MGMTMTQKILAAHAGLDQVTAEPHSGSNCLWCTCHSCDTEKTHNSMLVDVAITVIA